MEACSASLSSFVTDCICTINSFPVAPLRKSRERLSYCAVNSESCRRSCVREPSEALCTLITFSCSFMNWRISSAATFICAFRFAYFLTAFSPVAVLRSDSDMALISCVTCFKFSLTPFRDSE